MPENRVEFYRDTAGEWRWRFVAAENGNTLADSGEGYANLADAQAGFERVSLASTQTLTVSSIGYQEESGDAS